MFRYKPAFDSLIWVKLEPNSHERRLLERGQKYISKLAKIPGIEMIAIVNSLSMYATHPDSDIDLFIITQPGIIWFVRFFATLTLSMHWVWRRDADIAGNLCLSFFITTEAMDLSQVAIENDIYLYYWIYYMKPIFVKDTTYENFLSANSWVDVDEEQKIKNIKFEVHDTNIPPFCHPDTGRIPFKFILWALRKIFHINKDKRDLYEMIKRKEKNSKSMENSIWKETTYKKINALIRHFLFPHTQRTYEQLWTPEWVIISDQILKFHNSDRRKTIRDAIMEKYFDK